MRIEFIFYILFVTSILIIGCQKLVPAENEVEISSFGDDESHYNGHNCMDCHYSEGRGEGWFAVAGTCYGNTNHATIEIYKDTTASPIDIIEVDAESNFYTTNLIDFSQGIYAGVRSSSGTLRMMNTKQHVGQCNLCHGATTDKISINW